MDAWMDVWMCGPVMINLNYVLQLVPNECRETGGQLYHSFAIPTQDLSNLS